MYLPMLFTSLSLWKSSLQTASAYYWWPFNLSAFYSSFLPSLPWLFIKKGYNVLVVIIHVMMYSTPNFWWIQCAATQKPLGHLTSTTWLNFWSESHYLVLTVGLLRAHILTYKLRWINSNTLILPVWCDVDPWPGVIFSWLQCFMLW